MIWWWWDRKRDKESLPIFSNTSYLSDSPMMKFYAGSTMWSRRRLLCHRLCKNAGQGKKKKTTAKKKLVPSCLLGSTVKLVSSVLEKDSCRGRDCRMAVVCIGGYEGEKKTRGENPSTALVHKTVNPNSYGTGCMYLGRVSKLLDRGTRSSSDSFSVSVLASTNRRWPQQPVLALPT